MLQDFNTTSGRDPRSGSQERRSLQNVEVRRTSLSRWSDISPFRLRDIWPLGQTLPRLLCIDDEAKFYFRKLIPASPFEHLWSHFCSISILCTLPDFLAQYLSRSHFRISSISFSSAPGLFHAVPSYIGLHPLLLGPNEHLRQRSRDREHRSEVKRARTPRKRLFG